MDFAAAVPADREAYEPGAVFAAALRNHHICGTAYPIRHGRTLAPYRVAGPDVAAVLAQAWADVDELGLYAHVPFCETRCAFCEYVVIEGRAPRAECYLDLLAQELALYESVLGRRRHIVGFDIGGGTPLILTSAQIARLLALADRHVGLPAASAISIETTPRLAVEHPERLRECRALGIGRISMGIQTAHSELLRAVERQSQPATFNARAIDHMRAAGFERINVDLMYGLPRLDAGRWEATLRHAVTLAPDSITLYRTRHKGTRIEPQALRVSREDVAQQARIAHALLHAAGYAAPCGKNTYSRLAGDEGVSDYLTARVLRGTPYLGLGLGAQSWTATTLAYNLGAATKDLDAYARALGAQQLPIQDLYHLAPPAAWAKMIAVSFYFGRVELAAFETRFGVALAEVFACEIAWLVQRGYVELDAHALRLTPAGQDVFAGVVAQFYQGAVKRLLIETDWNADLERRQALRVRTTGRRQPQIGGRV